MNRVPIFDMDDFPTYIIRPRRTITMKNFDRSGFIQQGQESDILRDISSASPNMEDEMERQYRANYSPHFPYFKFGRKSK